MKNVAWLFLIFLSFYSCRNKKDLTSPEKKTELDYFSIKRGSYQVFKVEEKHFIAGEEHDSSHFLKVTHPEAWQNAEGSTSIKSYRYKKNTLNGTYSFNSVWSTTLKDNSKAIVMENNVPFLKLSYPVEENKTWNGNSFNTLGSETYTALNVGKPWDQYSLTVTVIQRNDSNLLARDYRMEVYAINIGLVYKETKTVRYSGSATDFGKGIIVDGIIQKQWLLENGKE